VIDWAGEIWYAFTGVSETVRSSRGGGGVIFQLAKQTGRTSFATRSFAAELRTALSQASAEIKEDRLLEIDFRDVEAITVSFADELVAKLAAERRAYGPEDSFLRIANASDEVAETIEVALQRRGLFIVSHRDSAAELLGAPLHLKETYAAALELGQFTARDLASRLGLKPPAANNRIKALAEAGALVRARQPVAGGGRRYSYEASLAA
jgi:hypothetical protein